MEKTYSTKQIALMTGVNEETVRRWVRDGKLIGDLNRGKKGGFMIKESDFNDFLIEHPKYNKLQVDQIDQQSLALATLNARIFEMEELINKSHFILEELRLIRNLLENRGL